jgi:hypothetical protein
MVNRQENEYPSNPCNKITGGPDPARKYRMRAPSNSIQHSSTLAPNAGSEVVSESDSLTINFR